MDFAKLKLKLASPEEILEWSYGEVTKAETINYRTQKPEKEGLFSEAIFGPTKDWECYCGKYRRIRYKGIICDRCNVEVTRSIVRRERMGHIKLASPVAHIWFLRSMPSRIASILDISLPNLERVIYFASYIVVTVNEELKTEAMKKLESEFKSLIKNTPNETEQTNLKDQRDREKENLKTLKKYAVLSELDYRDLSIKYGEVFEAGIGAEAIRNLLEGLNLKEEAKKAEEQLKSIDNPVTQKKALRRIRLLKNMAQNNIRPEWTIMTVLPVIPPLLRPMVPLDGGRFATSDLNDLYRRVINRNNRLKHLIDLRAPEVITKNEKRMLQEAVDALIDNGMRRGQTLVSASTGQKRALKSLADMLKGKQGRFRQNLLGKRVDYSGRSVIVIGPELGMGECGIPKYMALELFKPFIIHYLIENGFAHNIRSANHLIEQGVPEIWEALEYSIQDKYVLLNRAPTLHRLSVQAFKPKLIEGKSIKLPAMPTRAFNADFDGDQMAVHLPLTKEAQIEAKELMLSTHGILKPANGEPVAIATKDITFGCYYLTSINPNVNASDKPFANESEAMMAYDNDVILLRQPIMVDVSKDVEETNSRVIKTTIGRILFNKALPEDYLFINKTLNQTDLRKLEAEILHRYGEDRTVEFLDTIKDYGFHYATVSGVSWGMDDLKIPPDKKAILSEAEVIIEENKKLYEQGLLTEHERRTKAIEIWSITKTKLESSVKKQYIGEDAVNMMVSSKARGNWGTVTQLSGMRGLMVKPDGSLIELPVKSSFKEGLNVLEYFISTHGARKGLVDTALKTASAGYLTRRLIDVAQDVVIQEENCKDKEGYTLYPEDGKNIDEPMGKRLYGRVLLEDVKDAKGNIIVKKNHIVKREEAKRIDTLNLTSPIRVRSPINCKARYGLCKFCYGHDLARHELIGLGEAVGIITAQAIGEPGTQLTMRTFHTGGVASVSDITMGLPRVEEIFECRPPSVKALLSDVDGKVTSIEEKDRQYTIKIATDKGEEREFLTVPGGPPRVKTGDLITAGQQLSDGPVDLKELYKTSGDILIVARYIIKEVQNIYFSTGEGINEKHIELIIRQMFSRVRIINHGDTELLSGDVMERQTLEEVNDEAKEGNKKLATFEQLLLGITRVSLSTDSFLSAASFQETARVLIDTAITGREDKLRGLKENVIIGRLIPAGTGYNAGKKTEEEEDEKNEDTEKKDE
ncbi:MAG: DNA-directed RNA polymerase subunit beta' [Parcubacteria group bacterium]